MESKKTSFILYPADFLAAVHNFKKNEVADLIIALCETNFYGDVYKITAKARMTDIGNKTFPNETYRLSKFMGLVS